MKVGIKAVYGRFRMFFLYWILGVLGISINSEMVYDGNSKVYVCSVMLFIKCWYR